MCLKELEADTKTVLWWHMKLSFGQEQPLSGGGVPLGP